MHKAQHSKPSRKAHRNGWIAVIVLEAVGAYAALYALQYTHWYAPIDLSSSMGVQYLASDAGVVLTVVLWIAYGVGLPWSIWHDWPTSKDGKAVYDASHADARIRPRLKLGDDLAYFLRNKGMTNGATTIYDDIRAIQDMDDSQTAVQAASQPQTPDTNQSGQTPTGTIQTPQNAAEKR